MCFIPTLVGELDFKILISRALFSYGVHLLTHLQQLAEWLCRYCWDYLSSCLIHLHTSREPLILDVYSSTSGIFFTSELKICISYVVLFFILIPFCDCFVQLKWKITHSLFFRSVNFKFVPEPIFVSKAFAISLLIAHLVLLAAFAHYRWCK